ncbi:MAG: acyltransferase [Chitinophagaceae bacterium]|nr:acyltransferase [Chitinophagaceae bacterium]
MNLRVNKILPGKENQPVVLLRGVAALMVCIFHFTNGNENLLAEDNTIRVLGYYGKWGVDVFFIISGFVLPLSMYNSRYTIRNFVGFFKKRITRIEPPYIVSVLLVVVLSAVSAAMPGYRGQPFIIDWWNVAGHIAYLNIFNGAHWLCDVYWTLAVEFQYYLLIAACFFFIASKKMQWRILFFAAFTACYFFRLLDTRFIFFYTAYFSLGILLFQYSSGIIQLTEYLLLSAICLLMIWWTDGKFLTLLSAGTVLAILFIKQIPAAFKYLGLISYSLYLTHVPVGGRVINFVESSVQNIFVRYTSVLLALAVSIGFAAVFYRLIEKRCKAWASAIRY